MLSTLLFASSALGGTWTVAKVGTDGIYHAAKSAVSVDSDKSGNLYAAPYPVYHKLIDTSVGFAVPVDSSGGDGSFNAEANLVGWNMKVAKNGTTVSDCSGTVTTQNCNEGNWCNVPCGTILSSSECEALGWPEGCGTTDSDGNPAYWASEPWVNGCEGTNGGTCTQNDSSCCEAAFGYPQQFPGAQFCDTVWMICDGTPEQGVEYDLTIDLTLTSQWTGASVSPKTLKQKYVFDGEPQSYAGTYACAQPIDLSEQQLCKTAEGQTNWEYVEHPLYSYNEYNFDYPSADKDAKIVGAYWTEWAAYKRFDREADSARRRYYVQNTPFHQLTHLLYAFVPVCGNGETGQGQLALCAVNDCQSEDPEDLNFGNPYFNLRARACKFTADGEEAATAAATGLNQLDSDFEVAIHDPWSAFHVGGGQLMAIESAKQQYPGLTVLPSVGGWTLSKMFFYMDDKANRTKFVDSCEKFLRTWKVFDGIDIDWEFPGGGGQDDGTSVNLWEWPLDNSSKVNMKILKQEGKLTAVTKTMDVTGNANMKDAQTYTALMTDLRAMLDRLGAEFGRTYQLSSAVSAGAAKIAEVDYASVADKMDHIFIMSYDLDGAWSTKVGHQTNLYPHPDTEMDSCAGAAEAIAAQGFPMEKLVMGAAMYGRGWKNVGEGHSESYIEEDGSVVQATNWFGHGTDSTEGCDGDVEQGVVDYSTIASGYESGSCQYFYDTCAEAPLLNCNGQVYTYDNPRSVAAKGKYVLDKNMAGIFAWVLDQDNGDILNAMHESVGHTIKSGTPILRSGGYPARSCDGTAVVTEAPSAATTPQATTPEAVTTPSTEKCCVVVSKIDRYSECAVDSASQCGSDACVWTAADNCIDHVHGNGSVVPTAAPVVTDAPTTVTTPAPTTVTTPAPTTVATAAPTAAPVVTEAPAAGGSSGGCYVLPDEDGFGAFCNTTSFNDCYTYPASCAWDGSAPAGSGCVVKANADTLPFVAFCKNVTSASACNAAYCEWV